MCIESCGHILDPGVGYGIDDTEDWAAWGISRRNVKAAVSLVKPDLIDAAHLWNICQKATSSYVEDNQVWGKRHVVAIRAPNQEVIERALDQPGGLALADRISVGDPHAPRVNHRDLSSRWITVDFRHGNVEALCIGVPYGLLQTVRSAMGLYAVEENLAQDLAGFRGDETHKGSILGIVGHQQNVIPFIEGHLISPFFTAGRDGINAPGRV